MIPLEVLKPVTPGRVTELPETGTQVPGRFVHVELEILTACDLACFACDRFSDVTTAPNMTVSQVARFVDESLALNWEWERIRLLGGEPTLHPHLEEIVGHLMRYRRRYPKVFLQLLSNGRGRLAKVRDWLVDRGVDPHVEGKTKGETPEWFNNQRLCPADDPSVGVLPPCGIFGVHGCGIGLTRYGYFLDGAGASAARVAGYDVGVQNLCDVTWDSMIEQSKVLCRICGHWNPSDSIVTKKVTETGEVTGPFWTQKLKEFKANKPKLTVYGTGIKG